MASVWNTDNIIDVAESVGISSLNKDVVEQLARDVEFRLGQVIEEALRFMRHGKRTTLTTQDISQALRLLDVEPLYGYESTRPLRFGEASIGPGQPLYYVEDEEVDFEKLINAPLPRVPREMSLTAHWLAVEGVQPSIPQNPTTADQKSQELLPKGTGAGALAALGGNDNVAVKPLVKHILSKELLLYFERICGAILDQPNDEYRTAAFASLRSDPALHQLVPYFVQFVAEKVTHNLKSLFVLEQMLQMLSALLDNASLYMAPYVASIVPSVLTCLIGRRIGNAPPDGPLAHFALRDLAASLLATIVKKYGDCATTLKPRITRSCLKTFLDSHKPFGSHYGAFHGLQCVADTAGMRALVLPNLKAYDVVLKQGLGEDANREQAERVAVILMKGLQSLESEAIRTGRNGHPDGEELQTRLTDAIGEVMGTRVYQTRNAALTATILEADVGI